MNMIYTTILHPVRKQFGLSANDYCVCDLIYLSGASPANAVPGWSNLSRAKMADLLDLSRQSIIQIIGRLEQKGLVERGQADSLRTTRIWYNAVTGCKENLQGVKKVDGLEVSKKFTGCKESLQQPVKKVDTYNNSINIVSSPLRNADENFSTEPAEELTTPTSLIGKADAQYPPVAPPPPYRLDPMPDRSPPPEPDAPTQEEVRRFFHLQMGPDWLADKFFYQYDAVDWQDKHKRPIRKWKSLAQSWIVDYKQSPNKYTHEPTDHQKARNRGTGRSETGTAYSAKRSPFVSDDEFADYLRRKHGNLFDGRQEPEAALGRDCQEIGYEDA